MAIIDWPTTRAFRGATFTLALDTSESTFTGFFTGNRQRSSHLADRLRATLLVPPTPVAAEGAARESFMLGWRSTGDWVRMAMPHRAAPLGTAWGSVTLGASAAAGARSITLAGVLARPNLLFYSGMEIDANADNLADGWPLFSSGNTGFVDKATVAGNGSPRGQTVFSNALGPLATDQMGIYRIGVPCTQGLVYSFSADTKDTILTVRLQINWFTVASALISSSTADFTFSGGTWARRTLTATAPATAAKCDVYIIGQAQSGGPTNAAISIDNVQLEVGATATPYAGLATLLGGDWLGVGGNLLQVAYAGAVADDAGNMTVPLSMPLPKAVTSGAVVTHAAPTGLWELDDDGLQLDYSAPLVQGGFAIPLRQVVA